MKSISKIEFVFVDYDAVEFSIDDIRLFGVINIIKPECFYELAIEISNENESKKFDRFMRRDDVIGVCVYYDDDTNDYFQVNYKYDGDNRTKNVYQKTEISDFGNLYIVISADSGLDDYFKWRNDKDYIESREGEILE